MLKCRFKNFQERKNTRVLLLCLLCDPCIVENLKLFRNRKFGEIGYMWEFHGLVLVKYQLSVRWLQKRCCHPVMQIIMICFECVISIVHGEKLISVIESRIVYIFSLIKYGYCNLVFSMYPS